MGMEAELAAGVAGGTFVTGAWGLLACERVAGQGTAGAEHDTCPTATRQMIREGQRASMGQVGIVGWSADEDTSGAELC
jgi:hypothetical protein